MTSLARYLSRPPEQRDSYPLNFQDYLNFFSFNGVNYPVASFRQTLLNNAEEIGNDYSSLIAGAYRSNGVVFACMLVRLLHFTEARFQWRQLRGGRPGNLWGDSGLSLLETPWPNGTTGDLLGRMISDADLAGNAYIAREGDRLARLRPDWVSIVLGSRTGRSDWVAGDGDTEVAGYVYFPGGRDSGREPVPYAPFEVAHWAPIVDPEASYRGMSWLTPIVREIMADGSMTSHKLNFLRNGATVNLVVKFQTQKQDEFDAAMARFRENHESVANAYKTLFLATGTEVTPVGADLQQMDFKAVQGAGELRIASAARVPPVILGLSEGLQGSTLNSGNFNSSRRMFADGVMRPLWRGAAAALANVVTVPGGSTLWYDDRDISFLKEDMADLAKVQQMQAAAAFSAVQAGFTQASIVDWLASGDITRLVESGLTSVQLHPPGSPPSNGNGISQMPTLSSGGT